MQDGGAAGRNGQGYRGLPATPVRAVHARQLHGSQLHTVALSVSVSLSHVLCCWVGSLVPSTLPLCSQRVSRYLECY
jgi:hypothetical protein